MTSVLPPARKHLGQNFLIDPNIVRKIVEAAVLGPEETVLEIGPGRGILTRALCAAAGRVVAVEIDPRLCDHLHASLGDCGNLELHEGDAIEWSFEGLPPRTVVVANLPYYASTPLLFRLIEERRRFARAVVMLQVEVAARLAARPRTKDYGILSVLTQTAAEPRVLFRVSPNCFRPRPEVGSAVVALTFRPPRLSPDEERMCSRLVRAAFAHRRKRILNSLRDEGWSTAMTDAVRDVLLPKGERRAEEVSPAEYVDLAMRLAGPEGVASPPSSRRPE